MKGLLLAGAVITLVLVHGTSGRPQTFQIASRDATYLAVISSSTPPSPVPEPGTLALFGGGLLLLGAVVRRRRLGNTK